MLPVLVLGHFLPRARHFKVGWASSKKSKILIETNQLITRGKTCFTLFNDDTLSTLKDDEDSITSLTSLENGQPTENIIPVVQRLNYNNLNYGVFSRNSKTNNQININKHPAKPNRKSLLKHDKYDNISIAENDDKDFDLYATKEETDHETELKVNCKWLCIIFKKTP